MTGMAPTWVYWSHASVGTRHGDRSSSWHCRARVLKTLDSCRQCHTSNGRSLEYQRVLKTLRADAVQGRLRGTQWGKAARRTLAASKSVFGTNELTSFKGAPHFRPARFASDRPSPNELQHRCGCHLSAYAQTQTQRRTRSDAHMNARDSRDTVTETKWYSVGLPAHAAVLWAGGPRRRVRARRRCLKCGVVWYGMICSRARLCKAVGKYDVPPMWYIRLWR